MLRLVHVVDETHAFMPTDDPTMPDPNLVAAVQKALRTTGQKVLSTCAAVVREAGLEADTTMKLSKRLALAFTTQSKRRRLAGLPISS